MISDALRDVANERDRQVAVLGYEPQHDDAQDDGSIAMVAAVYALPPANRLVQVDSGGRVVMNYLWPRSWSPSHYKPGERRDELVRAGALILAEIERLDRQAKG